MLAVKPFSTVHRNKSQKKCGSGGGVGTSHVGAG